MPATNISALVARHPALVLDMSPQQVHAQLRHLELHLPGVDVQLLVFDEPAFLRVDVPKVRPSCPLPLFLARPVSLPCSAQVQLVLAEVPRRRPSSSRPAAR
jgi:hypothetical protein